MQIKYPPLHDLCSQSPYPKISSFANALVEYMGYGSASTRAITIWPICSLIITHKNFVVYYNVEILIYQQVDWVH